jgi:putative restriction endonuclease
VNPEDVDHRVRLATFAFLSEQTQIHGEVLSRKTLAEGFTFEQRRVPLIGPQGIFKPAILPEMPLTITTVPIVEGKKRPYEDDLLRYRYRGIDPNHRDNVGLRRTMERQIPLVYFYGIVPGQYMPIWPVYIVGDDARDLCFTVAVDEPKLAELHAGASSDPSEEVRRSYLTRVALQRMHQQSFRQRVLRAYRDHCAICRLRHRELLDAAHIIPDLDPRGDPVVSNGLSLCKLHHASFDRNILGIRPNLTVEIREDVLVELDGPMLEHGLQGFQGMRILTPRAADLKPNPDFLAERYELFRKAG